MSVRGEKPKYGADSISLIDIWRNILLPVLYILFVIFIFGLFYVFWLILKWILWALAWVWNQLFGKNKDDEEEDKEYKTNIT